MSREFGETAHGDAWISTHGAGIGHPKDDPLGTGPVSQRATTTTETYDGQRSIGVLGHVAAVVVIVPYFDLCKVSSTERRRSAQHENGNGCHNSKTNEKQ
jgi:hypothetical protein